MNATVAFKMVPAVKVETSLYAEEAINERDPSFQLSSYSTDSEPTAARAAMLTWDEAETWAEMCAVRPLLALLS